jgi:hypothetical protein
MCQFLRLYIKMGAKKKGKKKGKKKKEEPLPAASAEEIN